MGGIDPWIVGGAMLVTLGVAISGCAGALALSTWGSKTHEVLLATYAAWALWLLALPIWRGYRLVIGGGIAPPAWFEKANPIWLVAAHTFGQVPWTQVTNSLSSAEVCWPQHC